MRQRLLLVVLCLSATLSLFAATGTLSSGNYYIPEGESIGKVDLVWSSTGCSYTQLWVQMNGDDEKLCTAKSESGSWHFSEVIKNASYTFRLYSATAAGSVPGYKGELLDELELPTASITATDYTFADGSSTGSVKLSWSVTGYSYTQIWVQKDNGEEKLCISKGQEGTYIPAWLLKNSTYKFKLYSATAAECEEANKGVFLNQLVVQDGILVASNYELAEGENVGSVMLNWHETDYKYTQLWVQMEGDVEKLGTAGCSSGSWKFGDLIEGVKYTFRLYASDIEGANQKENGSLMEEISLPIGELNAAMYVIPTDPLNNNTGTAYIDWTTENVPCTQLWVQKDNGAEVLYQARETSGSVHPEWILKGSEYKFRLYTASALGADSDKGFLLDEITITGVKPLEKMVGMNKFNLLHQYAGQYNGVDLTEERLELYRRMARKSITDAKDIGCNFFRITANFIKDYEMPIFFGDRETFWEASDAMYDDLEELDMKIAPSLCWNFEQYSSYFNETNEEFLTNPNSQSKLALKEFITAYLDRYKDRSAVLYWELHNEFNLAINLADFPGVTVEAWSQHMKWMCDLIRELDPSHMITSGNGEPRTCGWHLWKDGVGHWTLDTYEQFKEILYVENQYCDIVSVHTYCRYNDHLRWGEYTDPDDYGYISKLKEAVDEMHKILYIGEFGDGDNMVKDLDEMINSIYDHLQIDLSGLTLAEIQAVCDNLEIEYTSKLTSTQLIYKIHSEKVKPVWEGGWINTSYPVTLGILEQIAVNEIPFSAPWGWQFYQFSTWDEEGYEGFCYDPAIAKDVVEKIIETNEALSDFEWELDENDNTPPQVILSYPPNNDHFSYSKEFIWSKVSDNNLDIDKVKLYVDGKYVSTSLEFPYRNLLDFNDLESGVHKVVVRAFDKAGNFGEDSIVLRKGGDFKPVIPNAIIQGDDIVIKWKDNFINESGYLLERRVDGGVWDDDFAFVQNTLYVDSDTDGGDLYEYRLSAVFEDGSKSDKSDFAIAKNIKFPLVSGKTYYIRNGASTNIVAGLKNRSGYINGPNLIEKHTIDGDRYQQWIAIREGDAYRFVSVYDAKAMEMNSDNNYIYGVGNSDISKQLWQLEDNGDGTYRIKSLFNESLYLSLNDAKSGIVMREELNSDLQNWIFDPKWDFAPINFELSHQTVCENNSVGDIVGELQSATTPISYSLPASHFDNDLFTIENGNLVANDCFANLDREVFEVEIKASYDGKRLNKTFEIYYSDGNFLKRGLGDEENSRGSSANGDFEISLFPNPTSGVLYVGVSGDRFIYEITNLQGQIIKTGDLTRGLQFMDISNLTDGVYIFRLSDEENVLEKRIIKID